MIGFQSNQIGLDGWWVRGVKDKCFSKRRLRKYCFVEHQLLITVKWIVTSATSEHSYNWLMCTLCPGVESLVMMSLAASCHIHIVWYVCARVLTFYFCNHPLISTRLIHKSYPCISLYSHTWPCTGCKERRRRGTILSFSFSHFRSETNHHCHRTTTAHSTASQF